MSPDPCSAPDATAPGPASSGFQPPSVEALARQFPQLEVLELLGKGGMGAVYKARQTGLDRLVAVKILPSEVGRDPSFAERFAREARALARLGHPNIVAVYDFGKTSDGLFYFVMEYVDGVNLRQAIQSGGMASKEALAIVPQICDALQFAHDEGIVHRDIKPENILVDKKGRVKIADFGLAKLLGQAPGDVSLTASQQVMGTLRYMAPEQMEGTKAVDHRADIYSLGVVFYELLTGEVPVGRFQPPSEKVRVDVRLDEVVLRSMERDVERRYQHVSEVKTAVEGVTSTPQVPVAPAPDAIRRQVKGPALGLLATTIFNWLIVLWFLFGVPLILHRSTGPQREIPMLISTGFGVWLVFLTTLMTVGALKMKRLESYGWAVTASIIGILGGAIALPFGIWALVVLIRPEVKAAFGAARKTGMKPVKVLLITLVISLLLGFAFWEVVQGLGSRMGAMRKAQPVAVTTLKSFSTADPTIAKDLVMENGGWLANCAEPRTIPLFEVPNPGVEDCTVIYRAQLKTEGLKGRAYLEMWCRLPGQGEAFSRGLDHAAMGSTDWSSHETPFFLKKGEKPDLLRLNLVVEGAGRVGIRNVAVRTNAKQSPAASAPPVPSAEKSEMTAADVLRKMGEKYASISSFTASGQVVSEVTPAGGGAATPIKHTFTLNLARPEFYRITWINASAPEVVRQGAAWNAGDGHKTLIAGKVGAYLNREITLATATGVSGGIANTVPGMFFKDDASSLLKSLTNPTLLPEETVGAEACHVVAADQKPGKVTLWITKKDWLLKKIQTKIGAESRQEIKPGTNDISDESLKKLLKAMGQESTPDAVNKMKKQMAEGLKMIGSISATITATYETIRVNEVMIKEDFEVSVPDASRRPDDSPGPSSDKGKKTDPPAKGK